MLFACLGAAMSTNNTLSASQVVRCLAAAMAMVL